MEAEGGPVSHGAAGKALYTSFPQRIKAILKRFSDYMLDRQISKEALFTELDKNGDDKVHMEELRHFVTENQMVEGL